MKGVVVASCSLLFLSFSAFAQPEGAGIAFQISGGFTNSVGNTGRYLDNGWNIQGGLGYNFNQWVGALIDVGYNDMGVNSTTLTNLGYPGGGVHVFSATLDPIVHLTPKSHFDVYVTGGGGFYHRYQDFTAPTVSTGFGCEPFFGCGPIAISSTAVLASSSVNKPGIDAGAGIAFGTPWHGKIFAEARYDRIFMGNFHTDYVPVSFGFRW